MNFPVKKRASNGKGSKLHQDFDARGIAILTAALAEFCQGGYESTSISAIAKRVGIADGLIYKHFTGKEQLLYEAIAWRYQHIARDIMKQVEAGGDARQRLERFVTLQIKAWHEDTPFMLLHFQVSRRPAAEYAAELGNIYRTFLEFLDSILRDGVKVGLFRADLEIRSSRNFIIGGTDYCVWSALATGRQINVPKLCRQTLGFIMPSLAAGTGPSASR